MGGRLILDPKKFSELRVLPPNEVDGSERIPLVKGDENPAVTIDTVRAGMGDKHFTQEFTNIDEVHVEHNLGKKPAVTVMNSAGDEVVGDINHINDNELIILFSNSFTGILTCN